MMKCHLRLQELYAQLSDEDSEEIASKSCVSLIQEMELFCNFCGQRYGDHDDSLQALRCSHIFHEKYVLFEIFFANKICYDFLIILKFSDVYMIFLWNVTTQFVRNVNDKLL